jgi:hypothetical protein
MDEIARWQPSKKAAEAMESTRRERATIMELRGELGAILVDLDEMLTVCLTLFFTPSLIPKAESMPEGEAVSARMAQIEALKRTPDGIGLDNLRTRVLGPMDMAVKVEHLKCALAESGLDAEFDGLPGEINRLRNVRNAIAHSTVSPSMENFEEYRAAIEAEEPHDWYSRRATRRGPEEVKIDIDELRSALHATRDCCGSLIRLQIGLIGWKSDTGAPASLRTFDAANECHVVGCHDHAEVFLNEDLDRVCRMHANAEVWILVKEGASALRAQPRSDTPA